MPVENTKAPFITFYSFKGGVGRSMALINTAAIMAERGFRVLVIDMDLEAPGLSFLMRDAVMSNANPPATPSPQVGLIDLLTDAKERGAESNLFALSVAQMLDIYTCPYPIPGPKAASKKSAKSGPKNVPVASPNEGSLRIMPAGALDDNYTARFSDLNLRGLYEEGLGEPLMRTVKKKLAESGLVDFVLIDSRTGFSDEAGVCTRDLADYLVILSGLNKQNVEGTSNFLRVLRGATNGKVDFQIILSPVPNWEDELTAKRKKVAQVAFNKAWGKSVDLDLEIPYHPRLALTEEPHIFRQKTGFLADAYRKIEKQVLKGIGLDVATLLPELSAAIWREDYLPALQKLRQFVRLDGAKSNLSKLILGLFFWQPDINMPKIKAEPSLAKIVSDPVGRRLVAFLVAHLSYDIGEFMTLILIEKLLHIDFELAEIGFQRWFAINPDDPSSRVSYAEFLLGNGQFPQAEKQLLVGVNYMAYVETYTHAQLCFSLWLATHLQNKPATPWLQGFKFYLQQGFKRHPWNFTRMLAQAEKLLTPEDFTFAQALADAFLDADKLPRLDQFEQWQTLEAKPVK